MLGFTSVGEPRTNERVNAPSQLMWLNVGDIRRYIDRHAGDERRSGRSLYPFFFSRKEEVGIYGRLAATPGPAVRRKAKPRRPAARSRPHPARVDAF
jgi:hypothetical protein